MHQGEKRLIFCLRQCFLTPSLYYKLGCWPILKNGREVASII